MSSVTRTSHANRVVRGQRRALIEQRLLEATERLMAGGMTFTELSVDRLATEAGMSRRTFYVYYQDKTDLLRRLAQQVFIELDQAGRLWWEVAERREYSDVKRAMRAIIDTYRTHAALLTAVIETAAYDSELGETYRGLLETNAATVATLVIEPGKDSGAIRPDLPARETASALSWMVERTCHQILRFASPDDDERLADSFAQIIWGSLYLESAPRH